ncbi:FkbM family methyltransferase [Sulfolobus sp. A20-N-F6]|uniref:FkbM family methyltransferase n=1 Tax=Saccharolobus sp. A20 TaxID=1891280 RepID=UPI0009F241C1|nr:FkbM family methyltransferase [Sulfolobus sp. A20]TRM75065.1 FkbM family methyltransferase [Sulfolobus sp. A20-N-F8]TRM78489.1 FkbM family methyltransferase [Sulfolobus sp. B5]TRM83539.1 FkbM family methyltransferase [Sulfolobus sp. A20-N-F6]TRN02206.1 FkbM family methyltransferase [Sulfolobus sp. F1]
MKFFYQTTFSLNRIHIYQKVYKNWFSVLQQVRKGSEEIHIKFRDGSSGICSLECARALVDLVQFYPDYFNPIKFHIRGNEVYYESTRIDTNPSGHVLRTASGWIEKDNYWYYPKYNVKFLKGHEVALFETFVQEQYNVDVEGREVVDVGANIGDTAVYFAIKGAKRVVGFEPLPSVYRIALENIKLNGLEDRVTLINAGVGSKDSMIRVPSTIDLDKSGGFHVTGEGDVEVPLYSLKGMRELVKDPYLLKIDCEGCEVDVIMNSDEIGFEKIIFEHHAFLTGVSYKKLIKKLEEEGYKCTARQAQRTAGISYLGIVSCENR